MKSEVFFTSTALAGIGKKGILTPDADGYYTMPVGGLDVFNSTGDFYTLAGAKELFNPEYDSSFQRRISSGCLYGEMGHPKMLPGQSMDSYIQRVMSIEETRWAAHFHSVWLDYENVRDKDGKRVVAIMAKLKPAGAFGPSLEQALANPKQDVCFSIRAFTEDKWVGKIKYRTLAQIVTFDMVTEPGINFARKFNSPALESLTNVQVQKHDFDSIRAQKGNTAMESTVASTMELFKNVGWDKTTVPAWHQWQK